MTITDAIATVQGHDNIAKAFGISEEEVKEVQRQFDVYLGDGKTEVEFEKWCEETDEEYGDTNTGRTSAEF